MLSTLLILAALSDAPKCGCCEVKTDAKCPSCPAKKAEATPKVSTPLCPDDCRCPFPSACGLPNCECKPALGWVPPTMDRWATFPQYPGYRFWGRPVNGVFRFTHFMTPTREVRAVHPVAAKSTTGFLCRCGTMCAARWGGICQSGCACPIGH